MRQTCNGLLPLYTPNCPVTILSKELGDYPLMAPPMIDDRKFYDRKGMF